jgi:hypothetical protein
MMAFAQYSRVILVRDIEEDSVTFPKGTRGVIVDARDDGINDLVEINDPTFAVISVPVHDLAPVSAD